MSSTTILQPGTGCNPYYARKHGVPIENTLDNVLASFYESYQPTGASNSVDAAEMLFKGTAPDFRRPAATPAPTAPEAKEFAPQPSDYASTFGTTPRTPAPAAAPTPVEPAPIDPEWALAPGHGWSGRDSRNHLAALKYLDTKDAATAIEKGFDLATRLGEKVSGQTGWAAGLLAASAAVMMSAFAVASPAVGIALGGVALVGTFNAFDLIADGRLDRDNGAILRDMATRLHEAQWNTIGERPSHRGDYEHSFSLYKPL